MARGARVYRAQSTVLADRISARRLVSPQAGRKVIFLTASTVVDSVLEDDLFRGHGTDVGVCLIVFVRVEHVIGSFQEVVE